MDASRATRRRIAFGSTLGAGVLLASALFGMVNYLANRHFERWDWTSAELYTLSEKSVNVLSGLDEEIDVVVFMDGGSDVSGQVAELLARYESASPRISVRTLDPVRNPAEAQRLIDEYDIQRADVVVFRGAGDKRVVEGADLAEYDYSAVQMGGAPELTAFKGEQLFTSAIIELVERQKPKIVFTSGHGEKRIDDLTAAGLSSLRDFLGQDNFELETWTTLGQTAVPAGTDLVVVAGPASPFNAQEVELLDSYLGGGGRLLVLVDPMLTAETQLAGTGLEGWLLSRGVVLDDGIVVDPAKLLPFFGAETIFADDYGVHGTTESLRQARLATVFALARPVGRADGVQATVTELVRTSPEGWGETDLDALGAVELGDDDVPGPVALGLVVELDAPETVAGAAESAVDEASQEGATPDGLDVAADEVRGGVLVVFGDSDFVSNAQLAQAGNVTLAANTLNWLVERESHLGIPPKDPGQARLTLTPQQRRLIFWLVIFGLPGAALVGGVTVFLSRRR